MRRYWRGAVCARMREERLGRTYNVIPVAPADYRRLAEQRLPRFLFDYIDGGANAEVTLAANAAGFRDIVLRQRVMRDVSTIDTSTVLSGEQAAMPVILAPVGMAGMMARRVSSSAAFRLIDRLSRFQPSSAKRWMPATCPTVHTVRRSWANASPFRSVRIRSARGSSWR